MTNALWWAAGAQEMERKNVALEQKLKEAEDKAIELDRAKYRAKLEVKTTSSP
jgi:hypothetical protein